MASCEPIESPSGRACEVRRKRWRRRISSLISPTTASAGTEVGSLLIWVGVVDIVIGFAGSGGGVPRFSGQSLQDALDAVVLLDRVIEHPGELGHALELKPPSDVPLQERGRSLKRLCRVLAGLLVADCGVEHPRLLQVCRDLDVGDREETDAGILDFPRQQFGELCANLVTDAGGSGSLRHDFGNKREGRTLALFCPAVARANHCAGGGGHPGTLSRPGWRPFRRRRPRSCRRP